KSALTDEIAKTSWLAETNDDSQWVVIDLEKPADMHAIQINYADYESDRYSRIEGLRHRYTLEGSLDGENWFTVIDKSNSFKDARDDDEELATGASARYVRYRESEVRSPQPARSQLRRFGKGTGKKPGDVKNFRLDRYADGRDIAL